MLGVHHQQRQNQRQNHLAMLMQHHVLSLMTSVAFSLEFVIEWISSGMLSPLDEMLEGLSVYSISTTRNDGGKDGQVCELRCDFVVVLFVVSMIIMY